MKYLYGLIIIIFTTLSSFGQVNFTDSNLPIFIIETDETIVDEPKVGANLGIINNAGRNYITDVFNDYNGRIGIELRGQTSQFLFEKKSYGFETRTINGDNLNVALLGLPEENDWILYGPYSDKTMIRNTLIYELSNDIGLYATRTRYCELVINGDYKGVYVLMEKIKRDKNRVDISKLEADEVTLPDVSGGYILKLDKYDFNDQNRFFSQFAGLENPMEYQVIYPKNEDLQTAQFDYIKDFIYDFEAALSSDNFRDENLGYRQYIEVNSFVDFLLLNELGRNPDAYRISTYFHKKHENDGGKLTMGPIWDFNIAMGNANFCLGSATTGWVFDYNDVCPDDAWLIGYWWDRFLSDSVFTAAIVNRWETLRQSTFSIDNIHQKIDEKAALLNEAQNRNQARWNTIGEPVWPNDFVGATYEAEVDFLKNWFTNRIIWLDNNIDLLHQETIRSSNVDFSIGPNPFKDELNIELRQAELGETVLRIYNILGQQIVAFKIDVEPNITQNFSVPTAIISTLEKGVYFYNLSIDDELIDKGKLLKQ